jgi:hypothetical protein
MFKLSNTIFLIFIVAITGCKKDESQQIREIRTKQFSTEYLKKYPEDAVVVIRYENCTKSQDEKLEKCLFLTTNDDMGKYVVNKYITIREEYLRDGKLAEK